MSELEALKLLRRIDEGVAGKSGEAFFRQIVQDIALALNAHAAFTSRLLPDRRAAMLAFWVDGRYEQCLEYALAGTPCEFVYRGEITRFGRDIGEVFPVDRDWFRQLGVNSYLGIPIVGETGEVHGHLAVMDRPERDWHEADVDVLRLFSLRTAVELERNRAQRLLEEANVSLQDANAQLRGEMEQRAAVERELHAARLAAEAANRAKSVFISQMSHELRTPLNGILGYAQLLRRQPATLNEQQRDGLDVIARSGEHLLNLVNDLLDLARIEAGRLELRSDSFSFGTLLRDVADLIRVRAERAGQTFGVDVQGDLPATIVADERALRQVLLNLLGNAVKFTPRGGEIALQVRGEPRTSDRWRLEFGIRDSGIGIAADELARIFEPFHRVVDDDRQVEGTGLGLAITQGLVCSMGGGIDVQSTPGRGTVFTVHAEFATGHAIEKTALRSRVCGYTGPRRSVLVADDDAVNRHLLARLLLELGFDVRTAADGRQALELLRGSATDLLITDLVMPYVDGIELTQVLHGAADRKPPLILAVSASASDYSSQEALRAGCDAFLSKPLELDLLLNRIGELLDLDWQYATPSTGQETRVAEADPASFELRADVRDELFHLAMLGDVTALGDRATAMLADDPRANSFCAQLRRLAEQYDTAGIRRLLATHANGVS
jgi:signal transduction histidine kinase/ActR/RegA family two-component response regulator